MLGSIFNSVNLPGNFKACGFFFFLLPKNPKLYADHFFNPGYLDLNGFEVKSNAKIEEGSRFSSDEKDVIITSIMTLHMVSITFCLDVGNDWYFILTV